MDNQKLVNEIIDGCTSHESITNLLRKTKILSFRLGGIDAVSWTDFELNGYPEDAELPDYRKIEPDICIDVMSPRIQATSQLISIVMLEKAIGKVHARRMVDPWIRGPIVNLEHLGADPHMQYRRDLPIEIASKLSNQLTNFFSCTAIYLRTSGRSYTAIIDQLKTRLLGYILEVSALVDVSGGQISKEEVTRIFHVNVYGGNTIIGAENSMVQSISISAPETLSDLPAALKALGIPEGEIEALLESIEKDEVSKKKKLGARVKEWLVKAASGIAEGTWDVGKKVTTELLTEFIKKANGL